LAMNASVSEGGQDCPIDLYLSASAADGVNDDDDDDDTVL